MIFLNPVNFARIRRLHCRLQWRRERAASKIYLAVAVSWLAKPLPDLLGSLQLYADFLAEGEGSREKGKEE